jgi:hypothetical protein
MKTSDFITKKLNTVENNRIEVDHEVHMAREQCYNIASNAIELHRLLQQISETQGIDGWVAEKITLANDYCKTVKEFLEYELLTGGPNTVSEDASSGATSSASIAATTADPIFKKRKIIKRKSS